jgi:hypothetical protein
MTFKIFNGQSGHDINNGQDSTGVGWLKSSLDKDFASSQGQPLTHFSEWSIGNRLQAWLDPGIPECHQAFVSELHLPLCHFRVCPPYLLANMVLAAHWAFWSHMSDPSLQPL